MNKKIMALNCHTVEDFLATVDCPVDWKNYVRLAKLVYFPAVRIGKNTLPFKNTLINTLNSHAPDYRADFYDSFGQVTDARYHEMLTRYSDKPWMVLWSGGVDSTVIVTSILKNSTRQQRESITIVCNNSSVYENPLFYKNHVVPNFAIKSTNDFELSAHTLTNNYVICGHPADALFCQFGGAIAGYNQKHPGSLELPFRTHKDVLFEIMQDCLKFEKEFCAWWYDAMLENIESQQIPVESMHDFFWYNAFNLSYSGTKLREILYYAPRDPHSVELFWKNYLYWYDSADYQLWSMTNNQSGKKFGQHLGEYKKIAKQYIYDFDKNDYYYAFKQKIKSLDRLEFLKPPTFFYMLDDFTEFGATPDPDAMIMLLKDFQNSPT